MAVGRLAIVLVLCLASAASSLSASKLPQGERSIVLTGASGETVRIGTVTFVPDGDGARISVLIEAPEFSNEFLSMRPFRCLPGAKEMWCHLPYPYETSGRITADDLVDLEYALLFLFKQPSAFGIDAWNGLYFKLALDEQGGISGRLHETNLDVLAAPPENRRERVVKHSDLTLAEASSRRFTSIAIK
jgi:hypothetical protein